jgi:hypothetical protein
VATVATAGYLAVATAAVHALGLAGYRAGFVWAALAIAGGGGTVAAIGLGGRVTYRWVWAGAVAVLGLAIAGRLLDVAPPSRGRLRETLDDLDLRFFVLTATREAGHSWCRPTCPVVERTYQAPVGAPGPALLGVAGAMVRAELLEDDASVLRAEPTRRFAVVRDEMRVEVEAHQPEPGQRVVVTITARARR